LFFTQVHCSSTAKAQSQQPMVLHKLQTLLAVAVGLCAASASAFPECFTFTNNQPEDEKMVLDSVQDCTEGDWHRVSDDKYVFDGKCACTMEWDYRNADGWLIWDAEGEDCEINDLFIGYVYDNDYIGEGGEGPWDPTLQIYSSSVRWKLLYRIQTVSSWLRQPYVDIYECGNPPTTPPTPSPTSSPTTPPTSSPTSSPTLSPTSPESSHWIAAGNPWTGGWNGIVTQECAVDSKVQASQGTDIDQATDIAVSCCTDDGPAQRIFDGQCVQAMTYENAVSICDRYDMRLCTLNEMVRGDTQGRGCYHDWRYNWVSDLCGDSVTAHYVAKGSSTYNWPDGSAPDSYCQIDTDNQAAYKSSHFDYDIVVSCCSMDGTSGFRDTSQCDAHPATYQEAVDHCTAHNMRLCTQQEMLDDTTKGTGCAYDTAYSWVMDACDVETDASGSSQADSAGHYVALGRGGWGSGMHSYCQSDGDNQAAYDSNSRFDRDIAVSCCSMDGTQGDRPDCRAHPATYQQAVDLCTENNMRLCTQQEMLNGVTRRTGCYYDLAYNWVSDECDPGTDAAASSNVYGSNQVSESEGGAQSFDDLVPIVLGVSVGAAVIAVIVAFVVVMRRKNTGKRTEKELEDVVHVPDASAVSTVSVDGDETVGQ